MIAIFILDILVGLGLAVTYASYHLPTRRDS